MFTTLLAEIWLRGNRAFRREKGRGYSWGKGGSFHLVNEMSNPKAGMERANFEKSEITNICQGRKGGFTERRSRTTQKRLTPRRRSLERDLEKKEVAG